MSSAQTAIHGEGLGKPLPLNLSGRIPELDGVCGLVIGMVLIAHFTAGSARPVGPFFVRTGRCLSEDSPQRVGCRWSRRTPPHPSRQWLGQYLFEASI